MTDHEKCLRVRLILISNSKPRVRETKNYLLEFKVPVLYFLKDDVLRETDAYPEEVLSYLKYNRRVLIF